VNTSALFEDLPPQQDVWMSHFDAIIGAPDGFRVVASTPDAPVAALESPDRQIYGVQFHPEVAHTPRGQELLKNFLFGVCGCRPTWTHTSIIEQAVDAIRTQVGDEEVICGLSGGVDSAVAAALVHKAVGDQLTCVYVDNGLMRAEESEQVEETFRRQFQVDLVHVKAADGFLEVLDDVIEPERKRKAIGETFWRVFAEVARDLGDARFFVQGTLYPDVVESGSHSATGATIKSHHNLVAFPRDCTSSSSSRSATCSRTSARHRRGARPARGDRVATAVPRAWPCRAHHRTVTPERLEILRRADAIVVEEIKKAGLYKEVWQAFAVLPAVRSVGVMGDERTYAYPIIGRAVTSDDAMTATGRGCPTTSSSGCRAGSSTRYRVSTASRSTSLRSHPAPSSGSSGAALCVSCAFAVRYSDLTRHRVDRSRPGVASCAFAVRYSDLTRH